MTTATASPRLGADDMLDDHARGLIDARLEIIERILIGTVDRADRLAIVREVEARIYELLQDRGPADSDRDAVIAALGQLDPPEAYFSDEFGAPRRPSTMPRSTSARPSSFARSGGSTSAPPSSAKVGGILGLVALALSVGLSLMLTLMFLDADVARLVPLALLPSSLVTLIVATLAVVFSSYSRLATRLSVAGLVTGILSFFPAGFGAFLGAWAFIEGF